MFGLLEYVDTRISLLGKFQISLAFSIANKSFCKDKITPPMTKRKRTRRIKLNVEAHQQIIDSIDDLISDANRYDLGEFRAIKRSSAILRMLFYDTNNQTSLVKSLNDQDTIRMASFAPKIGENDVLNFGSVLTASFKDTSFNTQPYYNTFLFHEDFAPHWLPFSSWWAEPLFLMRDEVSDHKNILTREKCVTIMANQDGGVHFDNNIDTDYKNLQNGDTGFILQSAEAASLLLGYDTFKFDNIKFKDIGFAYLRQIVHETILSFIKYYQLNNKYIPNFEYNWTRKLNYTGFRLKVTD